MSDEWDLVDLDEPDPPADPEPAVGLCRPGDHVSASRAYGLYRHHGVLLEGGRVLHVNAGPTSSIYVCLGLRPAMVRIDPVARFLKTDPELTLEHKGDPERGLPVGAEGVPMPYHLLWGNCEQFARTSIGKSRRSIQVERALLGAGWVVVGLASLATPAVVATAAVGTIAAHSALAD
jgi:hypothetical protein